MEVDDEEVFHRNSFIYYRACPVVAAVGAAGGWSIIKNSSGIKVYERAVPPDLMEYMGVTAIDAKMEVIGEVLRDVPNFNKWQADCFGAQVEKKFDKNTMVIYMVLNPPLIEGRDIVLKNKTVYDWDNSKALITFAATDEVKIPVQKKRTRVTVMKGSYDMEYLGRSRTKFVYKLLVDPAGTFPRNGLFSNERISIQHAEDLKKIGRRREICQSLRKELKKKQISKKGREMRSM